MEKSDNLIKKLLVLISVLIVIILVVGLISINLLNSLKSGSNLKGELYTSPTSSTYSSTSSTYTPTSSTYSSTSSTYTPTSSTYSSTSSTYSSTSSTYTPTSSTYTSSSSVPPGCPASAKYVLPATNEYKMFIPGIWIPSQREDCSDLVSSTLHLIRSGDFYSWDCQALGCEWFVDSHAAPGYEETCGGDGTYSCGGTTNPNICVALPECDWDSKIQACGQVREFCNISYTIQVCSVCTEGTEEKDCGIGKKCCIQTGGYGVCYDPASQVCCGPEKCGDKYPRTSGENGFCVDNSGVCYQAGDNAKCIPNTQELPLFWVKDVSDQYNYIAGDLALQIYNQGKPLFDKAVLNGQLTLEGKGSVTKNSIDKVEIWNLNGDSLIGSLTGRVSGIDVIFNFGSLQYQTKFKYEKITGYKKVDNNVGRGRGGGRGDAEPSDEAIWETFKGTVTERSEIVGLGIPIFLNGVDRWSGWWVAPTVMTDFNTIFGGVQTGKGNFKIQLLTGEPVGTIVTISYVWKI